MPATDLAVLPPRSSFRRFFARRCSRMFELDRLVLDRGSPYRARNGLAPLVDFCNRITPRARPWTIRTPRTTTVVSHHRSSFRGWLRRLRNRFLLQSQFRRARPTDASRARDRVARRFPSCGLDSSRRDRSRRELRPAPLGSDTSCRELVVTADGASRRRPGTVTGARCELVMTKRGERFVRKERTEYVRSFR